MVGIKDVARQAGVSVGTVSNVINRPDLVSDETRIRVQSVIRRLGYVRSESARQLRAGASRIMALLVLDMGNPFFVDVAGGAERAARKAGLGVMVCNSAQSTSEEIEYLSLFAEQRVRGVLVTPADHTGRSLDTLRRQHIPFVLVDRVSADAAACSVSVDDVAGGRLAVQHLIGAGHRSVVYVGGPGELPQVRDRRAGALDALAEAGLPPRALTEVTADRLDVAAGRDAGARLIGLAPRPTAVFCANDLLALGVLQALFAARVSRPRRDRARRLRRHRVRGRRRRAPHLGPPAGRRHGPAGGRDADGGDRGRRRARAPAGRTPARTGRTRVEPAAALRPGAPVRERAHSRPCASEAARGQSRAHSKPRGQNRRAGARRGRAVPVRP